jgi:hypothetical protein
MQLIHQIILGLSLLLGILFIIFYYTYQGSGASDVLPTMTPLKQKKDIVTADVTQTTLLGSAGATVMGFFRLDAGDRTANHTQSFKPLLYIENNWYLEIASVPRQEASAQLRVQTNHGGTLGYETIELPPIPKQKWVFLAVLREGRRFDVLYDNRIVASQRLQSYPVVISSPLSIGATGIDGSAIHVIINGQRLAPSDIERERVAHVDTNNTVLEGNTIDMSFPILRFFAQCPSGLPCDPVTKPPSNNLYSWSTPYA